MDQKPHSWYIPRPSLTSTKNSHPDAIRRYHRDSEVIDIERPKRNSNSGQFSSSSSSTISSQHSKEPKISMETCIDTGGECEVKRGSRSSQGSSDSEQSIHVSCAIAFLCAFYNFIFTFKPAERLIPPPHRRQLGKFCQNSGALIASSSNERSIHWKSSHKH